MTGPVGPAGPDRLAVTVRGARTEDWGAVRELACLTGRAGDPIEAHRWPFFAELWIGPYQRLLPEWTCVADAAGRVVGYLTGCPDTEAFRRAARWAFTLPLLLGVARRRYRWNGDTRRFVREALGLARGVEGRLRNALPRTVQRDHPAHLHMNVAVDARRRGVGGLLLERHLAALRQAGVPGVRLVCGADAWGFYARHGFVDLGSLDPRSGVRVYAMGRRLAGPDAG